MAIHPSIPDDLWEVCSISLCGRIRKGKGRGGKRRNQLEKLWINLGRSTLGRNKYKSYKNGNRFLEDIHNFTDNRHFFFFFAGVVMKMFKNQTVIMVVQFSGKPKKNPTELNTSNGQVLYFVK